MHFDAIDDEAEVGRLLHGGLDLGITLIDTARGYWRSEERIGRHLAGRRHAFVLSTKFGYGVEGVADWSYPCIVEGVERALRRMRTDVIDIGHLHSCPLEILERSSVLIGSKTVAHLRAGIEAVQRGPLPVDVLATLDDAWRRHGRDWPGIV